jgi:hypothetical protein
MIVSHLKFKVEPSNEQSIDLLFELYNKHNTQVFYSLEVRRIFEEDIKEEANMKTVLAEKEANKKESIEDAEIPDNWDEPLLKPLLSKEKEEKVRNKGKVSKFRRIKGSLSDDEYDAGSDEDMSELFDDDFGSEYHLRRRQDRWREYDLRSKTHGRNELRALAGYKREPIMSPKNPADDMAEDVMRIVHKNVDIDALSSIRRPNHITRSERRRRDMALVSAYKYKTSARLEMEKNTVPLRLDLYYRGTKIGEIDEWANFHSVGRSLHSHEIRWHKDSPEEIALVVSFANPTEKATKEA